MPYATLQDGSRMYYIERGEGPTVVFQHGFLGSSWLFEKQVEYFGGHGYHAIAFDLKGHGKSDKPKDASYLLPEFAREIDYALDQIISDDEIVLLGHSMGGMIALCYATDPQLSWRLKGLILESTAAKLENPALDQYIEALRSGAIQVTDRATVENIMVSLCFHQQYRNTHPDLINEFVERTLQNEPHVALATMEAIVRHYDVTDKLDRISVPTLILHGESDIFIPPASAQALHQAIPNSQLVIFKGPIGHMLQYECTEDFHHAIEEHFKRIKSKTK